MLCPLYCCSAQALRGHGKEINDLAVHPHEPELVLSGSKVCRGGGTPLARAREGKVKGLGADQV